MKLSILTQFYPPDYAATGQLIEELATQLADQGIRVHVFTGQPGYAFEKGSAPAIENRDHLYIRRSRASRMCPQRIRGKALNGVLFCIRSGVHLLRAVWRGDILLVTTAPPYLPILGYLAKKVFGAPYVCLLYDLYPDIAVELEVITPQHWLTRLWHSLNRRIWQQAESIIVLSNTMKDRVVAHCPEVASKVHVIHSWADETWITPRPKTENWFAQEHDLTHKFTVLYSGNMGRCHDLDTIMAAVEELKQEPVQFVFIGSGAKYQSCMSYAQTQGLNNCLFLPYQDKKVLPYSLTACDLSLVSIAPGMEGLVAPSKFYGCLAAGRPVAVICEPHSYLQEVLAESGCGETFETGKPQDLVQFIRRLSQNPATVQQMGQAGRKYLEKHFTPELIAKQYYHVLQTSLRRHQLKKTLAKSQQKDNLEIPEEGLSARLGMSNRFVRWFGRSMGMW